MATQKAKYLFKKRGVYYFERRVPAELSVHYSSPKIVKSLKTKNSNRETKSINQRSSQSKIATSLDADMTANVIEAHNDGLHPSSILAVVVANVLEYAMRQSAEPDLIAGSMLYAMAGYFKRHLPEDYIKTSLTIPDAFSETSSRFAMTHDLVEAAADHLICTAEYNLAWDFSNTSKTEH